MRKFDWRFNQDQNAFQLYCDDEPICILTKDPLDDSLQALQEIHGIDIKNEIILAVEKELQLQFNDSEIAEIKHQLKETLTQFNP